jgi:hypothetical protein
MTNLEGMGSMIKKIWHKFSQGGEKGQALILVLILLIVGALVIAPLMANIGTGLKAGEVHEEKANELYAADAGIEDGLWQVKNDKLATKFPTYEPYDYFEYSGDSWTYPLGQTATDPDVNGLNVNVTIRNMWMPMGILVPTADEANITLKGTPGNEPKLIMTGTVIDVPTGSTPGSYRIKIAYSDPQNLLINTLGIWLPPGFTYVAGSNNLDDPANPSQKIYSSESLSAYKSGQAVVWTFANYPFGLDASHHFPGVNPAASPMESIITFQFNGTTGAKPSAVAWINTNLDLGGGITYTWDGDKQVYEITSTAGNTTIDGYTIKSELREMEAAIEGDYYATGNTLMRDANPDYYHIRDTWLSSDHSSSNNVPVESSQGAGDGVPEDAEVEFAYLYWTSWWDDSNKIAVDPLDPDTCSTYGNWDRSGSSPYFNTSWGGDGEVFSGHFGAGGVDGFRYLTLKDGRVDLSPYAQGLVTVSWNQGVALVSEGFADNCYNFDDWNRPIPNVWDEYNNYFRGYFSTGDNTNIDLNHSLSLGAFAPGTVTVSWKQWETVPSSPVWSDDCRDFDEWNHPTPNAWDEYNNRFRGHFNNGDNRDITHSEDLSAYASGGTVTLRWDQWRSGSGTIEPSDGLDVAFYDGTSWSTQASYRGSDFSGSAQTKSLTVPSGFLNNNFRVRFSLVDCGGNGEYINLDNINITYAPPPAPGPNDGLDIAYSDDDGATWSSNIPVFRGILDSFRPPANNVTLTIPDEYLTDRFRIRFILVGFGTSGQYLNLDDITVTCPAPLDPGPDDGLDFAFSRDGGANWSNDIQAFRGTIASGPFTYTIPSGYLTSDFKMRFYLVGFAGAGQYCNIDNIKITAMMPDSLVFFKIDGQQVYFDTSGQPQQGTQDITADRSQVIISIQGFSYSCFKDVTALVRAFSPSPTNPPTNRPGIANYTVGGVDGTLGHNNPAGNETQLSHAGWSLIIIYSSPATLGHQLFLYDQFTHAFDYDDVDFDEDDNPGPGGDITGFIVPDPIDENGDGIPDEVNVAKMTIMVGEGDDWIAGGSGYPGDFVAFNAPLSYRTSPSIPARDIPNSYKLWDGKISQVLPLSNIQNAPNNVWNGLSTAFNYDGIDVDTFYVPWGDPVSTGLLKPGDTSARLDLCTAQDNWNLVYVIISFRSKATTGGTVTYRIR